MMDHNTSDQSPLTSIPESEWQQIFSVLLTLVEPGKKRTRIAPNVHLCGHSLCVYGPARTDPIEDLSWMSEVSKLPAKERPREILVIDPTLCNADQVAQAKKKWPDHFRKKDKKRNLEANLEIWDSHRTKQQILQLPPLALRYFPNELVGGPARLERMKSSRAEYDEELRKLYGRIQFIGMSVYKEEATAAVDMEAIYIPLRLVGEAADEANPDTPRTDPSRFLARGERHVILGDPGSGKSTLFRFLALAGTHRPLQERYHVQPDDRLPVLVTLRQFADALKADPTLEMLDYVLETTSRDLELRQVDREFFEYYLYAGQAILLFDGVDELPGLHFKQDVRERIGKFLEKYPGNTALVTSRIVGYDEEIRYEELGFSHHRVARLLLDDIERFVGSWYKARIENRTERMRNVEDLVRIVRDPGVRAIRDLAENPLLLTIICLVHRVDAVLPDERVVLYQKCTETLLNTWHTWKFRTEDTRNRSRVEKQNQARMEFIAYSMHGALDTTDPSKRAIVSHDGLVKILSEYIREIERPRTGDPDQMAEVFFKFVRERAGLLIEVGQGQYSFVHLTFQEYLAAVHLKNSGEVGGVQVIWKDFIGARCGNPRWHEVIRLLIGSLTQEQSQRYFLERIVPDDDEKEASERAVLAGGCLLDGIAAAEEITDDIIRSLLLTAVRAESVDSLRKPLQQLLALADRDSDYRECVARHASSLSISGVSRKLTVPLTLCLVALGWEDSQLRTCGCLTMPRTAARDKHLFESLLAEDTPVTDAVAEEMELLRCVQTDLSLTSEYGNFLAVALCFIRTRYISKRENPSFEQILTTVLHSGPFFDLGRCAIEIGSASSKSSTLTLLGPALPDERSWEQFRKRASVLRHALDLTHDRDLTGLPEARHLELAQSRAQELTRKRAQELNRAFTLDLQRIGTLSPVRELARTSTSLWAECIARPEFHDKILGIACDVLDLQPRAQWWEALRVRSLPRVPELITWVNPTVWERTLRAFQTSKSEPSDCRHAASQLLLDIWLFMSKCIDSPSQSPFGELAEITRQHPSVYLCVAHCLRDLAFGDETRAGDLDAMVKSNDPVYRQLFRDAFWRD